MTIGGWIFILLMFICLMVMALAVDYSQSKDRGWTPLYILLWEPTVRAWHLFWHPITFLYNKWKGK